MVKPIHVGWGNVSASEVIKLLVVVAALLSALSPSPLAIWWRFVCGF
jgi:hypothetical protein